MIPLLVALTVPAALQGPLELTDAAGAPARFHAAGARATVVAFISTVCPISNDYHARYRALHEQYRDRGVQLLFVYSNRDESGEDVRKHARQSRFLFPVYLDPDNRLADALGAAFTPTVYVLNREGRVAYAGAVDDAVNPARVKHHYVRDAIEAVLAGRAVTPARTEADG